MKLFFLFFTYLLCANTLNLNLLSNFDILAQAAGSINAGILADNLNIGTGAILNAVTASVSSDLTIQGNLKLGSTGLLASKPTLNIATGATLIVDSLESVSGVVNVAGGGVLIVGGVATVGASSTVNVAANARAVFEQGVSIAAAASVNVAADAEVAFSGAISGTGSVVISGQAAFNASLSATYSASVDVKASGKAYVGAGIRTFSGAFTCAGEAVIQSGAFVTYSAAATLSADSMLEINAGAEAEFTGSVSGTGTIFADGSLKFTGSAAATCAADIEAGENAVFQISGNGLKTFTGTFTAGASVGATIEENASARFQGTATFGVVSLSENSELTTTGETTIQSAISLQSTSSIKFEGRGVINAGVTGGGMIQFSGEEESEVNALVIESSLSISANSQVRFKYPRGDAQTTVSGTVVVSGEGALNIASESALTVTGACTFEAEAAYGLFLETAESVSILTVSGDAKLNGTVTIETDITFEAGVEVAFIKYTNRLDASTFAQVNVVSSSSKRALMQGDDYEIEYQEDQAVIKGVGESNEDDSIFLTVAMLSLLAILL